MNNNQKELIIFVLVAAVVAAAYFVFSSQRLNKSMVEQYGEFNMPKKGLLDYVDIGIKKSESAHTALYGYNLSEEDRAKFDKSSTYGQEDNINAHSGISLRNIMGKWGVVLSSKKTANLLRINILDRSYPNFIQGSPEELNPPELKQTEIKMSCDGNTWEIIGALKTAQQEKYKTFNFTFSKSCPKSDGYYNYYIIADDTGNAYSYGHFGKTVNWIAIYAE